MALALCLTLLPAPAWAEETENNIAVQANTTNVAAVDPDCPVCAAEDADLSACKGTEQATPPLKNKGQQQERRAGLHPF